ncbi:MAG: hypothetical protein ACRENI_04530 [Gemmatimonadaceae bacterium]
MIEPETQLEEGLRYQKLGMLHKALEHYEATADSSADPAVVGEAYRREAHVYRAWCRWDEAIDAARRSATLARTNNLQDLYGEALNAEAIVHQERGDFDRALALYERILGSKVGDRLRGIALQNMGSLAAQRADLDAAEKYFRQSFRYFRRAGYAWGEAFALNNQSAVALDSGRFKLAEVLGGQALTAASKIGDQELMGIAELNTAEALAGQRELERAEAHAHDALGHFGPDGKELRLAQCYRVLGDVRTMRGEQRHAFDAYTRALGLAEAAGAHREVSRIRDCMQLLNVAE